MALLQTLRMNSRSVAGVIVKNGCGAKKRCWDVTQLNLRGSVSPHPKPGGRRASLTRKRRNSTQTITIFNKIIKLFSRHYCNNPTTNLPAVIEDSLKNQGGVRWSRPPLNLFHNMLQPQLACVEHSHPRKQKGARCQSSYRRHWDTCNQSIVLRPVCPTRRNGQDIT